MYVTDGICQDTHALICDSLNLNNKEYAPFFFTGIQKICLFITTIFRLRFGLNSILMAFLFLVFFIFHQINDFLIKKYSTRLDAREIKASSVRTTTALNHFLFIYFQPRERHFIAHNEKLTYFEWNILNVSFILNRI